MGKQKNPTPQTSQEDTFWEAVASKILFMMAFQGGRAGLISLEYHIRDETRRIAAPSHEEILLWLSKFLVIWQRVLEIDDYGTLTKIYVLSHYSKKKFVHLLDKARDI
jgi:hypothetical protein